ncbi:iron-containing alcohol dehydrogenase [Exilibacterium tricleocarpae]|uniref:Iron-containing alcohol dehydrogenase n=1 Tax=Exilibacterium tricleocarpae TaxID=2591008 RepID=A0A545TNH1_9GAMM|nr:iron-containing alcohol dehydrogenase [Exilibacterium tricleocarpae]TQV78764.1 iron-containing alcohol dehydrogenase [Exilibacterium tricleocarpae]
MTIVTWNYPTSIAFGPGAIAQLPQTCADLGMRRPLVVTDSGLKTAPFIARVLQDCRAAGLAAELFAGVQGNPVDENVAAALAAYKGQSCDGVVSVGGGSALDVGKTLALIAGQTASLWELGGAEDDWSGIDGDSIAPQIAVPTTAGTGSEVGRAAVITDTAARVKKIIFHPQMLPPRVIADPELTLGLPPHLTAATGMDALVHSFEAYCATGFHPMADGIALEAMRLVAASLPRAFADGGDLEARTQMLAAATMGATAFQKDLGAVHALAHAIGALFNVHHGLTNAILLPYVMLANRAAIEDKMVPLARVLNLPATGISSFEAVFEWVLALRGSLAIPHTLDEIQVAAGRADDIGSLAATDPCAAGNPIGFDAGHYAEIFTRAVEGQL